MRRAVQDIISKRNITRLEMEGINPSVDLDNLEPNQVRQQMCLSEETQDMLK